MEWRPEQQFYSVELSTSLRGRNPHSQIARELSNELFGHVDINELVAALALTLEPLTYLQRCTRFEEDISYMARTSTNGLLIYKNKFSIDLSFTADGKVMIQLDDQSPDIQVSRWQPVPNLTQFIETQGPLKLDVVAKRVEVPMLTFAKMCTISPCTPRCPLHEYIAAQWTEEFPA